MIEKSWPELSEELSRKCMDVLVRRAHDLEQGEITKEQFFVAADAIYDTVSGLVPWDVADVIAQVRKEAANDL